MLSALKELFGSHELLITWTMRDFKVRYSQSFLGAAWAILQPLALMIILSVVFSFFMKVPTDDIPYPVFAYAALLPWVFFTNSLTFSIPSLLNNMSLVSKIRFPREILPLSAIFVSFLDFVIASSIFILLLIIYQIPITWTIIFVPLIVVIQTLLTFGISLFASALTVFYRDVRFLVPVILQILMYLSPIIYPVTMVPEAFRPYYFLNPMAVLIDSYRRVILFGQVPDWPYLGLAALISVCLTVLSYRYFIYAGRQFADVI